MEIKPPRTPLRTNWSEYTERLEHYCRPAIIRTPEVVDSTAKELTKSIQLALRDSSSSKPATERRDPLPPLLRKLLEEKRQAKKTWMKTRHPRDKTRLNSLTNELKTALWEHRGDEWENPLINAEDDQPSLTRLCRQLSSEVTPMRPLFDRDGLLRYKAEDRAETAVRGRTR
ncbi:unnamed protein product [Danaus chrysippus]|uniref:(African queen) hypothetical protein n=1 Tax=Danaus chrysippus TaxID=151541 RepID=A0A8J2W6L9_9NEOP|nr:unnamed protein product [Danaus chrysippus]